MARGSGGRHGSRQGRVGGARFRLYVLAVAAAAAVVTLLIVVASLGGGGDGVSVGGPVVVPSPMPPGIEREGRVLGSADAPVTIVEYEDFQ